MAQITEEEINKIFSILYNDKTEYKSQEFIISKAELNDVVGKEPDGEIFVKYRLRFRDRRRKKWVQWCTANDQITGFK